MLKFFIAPVTLSILGFGLAYYLGGASMLGLVIFLTVLEVSLSFDNAVVNAKVLMRMDEKWRRRFLTWGMFVAVFGARLLFPVLLVSISSASTPFKILFLVFADPTAYAELVESATPIIHALGGAFLSMVALKYFFDEAKSVHWIGFIERKLATWGRIQAIEVAIVLIALLFCSWLLPVEGVAVLGAGCIGIVLFILMEGTVDALGAAAEGNMARQGLSLFIYLNLLDAAFSFDGVIGAFTLTTEVAVIVLGLGLGAYFVRSFTLLLVERKTLASLTYLEHGAYWAIAALAICMFVGLFQEVPDAIAGTVSLLFIGSAYLSSLRRNKVQPPAVAGS